MPIKKEAIRSYHEDNIQVCTITFIELPLAYLTMSIPSHDSLTNIQLAVNQAQ